MNEDQIITLTFNPRDIQALIYHLRQHHQTLRDQNAPDEHRQQLAELLEQIETQLDSQT